jgi:hypothetical protein
MSETTFERQILNKLIHLEKGMDTMKKEIDLIKERVVDDSILSEDDKQAIEETLQEEKEGKLFTKDQVFN